MSHKYAVGDAVEYTPRGLKAGLFTVVRQMPEEHQAYDWRYRVKNAQESFERNVFECDLSPAANAAFYPALQPLRRTGRT